MGMFDIFKKKKPVDPPGIKPAPIPAPVATKQPVSKKTPKEIANDKGEPYIAILSMDIDPENMHQGSFELDWNDKFIANLVRAGYLGKTDSDIVDQWFQNVCRHVVMETWEQEQAINPARYTKSRDIGGGRTEVS